MATITSVDTRNLDATPPKKPLPKIPGPECTCAPLLPGHEFEEGWDPNCPRHPASKLTNPPEPLPVSAADDGPPRRISEAEIVEAVAGALRSIDLPLDVRIGRIAVDPHYSIDDAELLTAGVAVKLSLIAREEP